MIVIVRAGSEKANSLIEPTFIAYLLWKASKLLFHSSLGSASKDDQRSSVQPFASYNFNLKIDLKLHAPRSDSDMILNQLFNFSDPSKVTHYEQRGSTMDRGPGAVHGRSLHPDCSESYGRGAPPLHQGDPRPHRVDLNPPFLLDFTTTTGDEK